MIIYSILGIIFGVLIIFITRKISIKPLKYLAGIGLFFLFSIIASSILYGDMVKRANSLIRIRHRDIINLMEKNNMSWHLNLEHGYYSCRVHNYLANYANQFGVKDGNQKIILGNIDFNLVDLEEKGLIRIEGNAHYRIIIWYDEPIFYVSTSKENQPRLILNLSYRKSRMEIV